MEKMPYATYEDLEKAYEKALSNILQKATLFNDLFDAKPNLEVTVIDALTEPDEELVVNLKWLVLSRKMGRIFLCKY